MENPEDLENALFGLQQKFKDSLPSRFQVMSSLWTSILTSQDNMTDNINEFHRNIHSITGTAGIFGADGIGNVARKLEIVVKEMSQRATPPDSDEQSKISEMLNTLIETGTNWHPS